MWIGVRTRLPRCSGTLLSQAASGWQHRTLVGPGLGDALNQSRRSAQADAEQSASQPAQVINVEQLLSVLRDMLALKAIRGTRGGSELTEGDDYRSY